MKRTALALLGLMLSLASSGWAQNSGIQGVVSDQSNAMIPAVEVVATNVATQVTYTAQTNAQGFYRIPFLSPGNYRIEAEAEGFSKAARENLKVDVQQIARVDFKLSVGAVTEVIEVSAAAALLESEQAMMGQVIENKRIIEMPLNQRNYLELARLSAGIIPGASIGRGTRPGRNEAGFVGMGARGYQNEIMIDGVDNGSRAGGGPLGFEAQASKPAVDAVGEFKVVTNNFSAEYGFRLGPKVLVSIKSGTNDLHGSVYEFLRNDKLDGTNFFANRAGSAKPTLRQNQFGGTFGGPIVKDKTFGFFSYQGTRIRVGRSITATVPSQAARSGDFSNERVNLNTIFDPMSTTGAAANAVRTRFPNDVVPASRFDPISSPLVSRYPLPNVSGREFDANNFFWAPSDSDDAEQFDFRIDHNFSDKDRIFFRQSIRRQFRVTQSILPVQAGGDGGETVDLNGDNMAFSWTHSFAPTLHNEARFGFTHFPTRFDTLIQEPLNAQLGIKGAPGDSFDDGLNQGFTHFNIGSYENLGTQCCWPNINNMDNIQFFDNLMMQKGNHTIKMGYDWRRLNVFREAMRFRRGEFGFSGDFTAERPNVASSRTMTGNSLADMLQGWANRTQVGNVSGENAVVPYHATYIQDDWKLNPKLTVTLGLRWEFFQGTFYPQGHIPGRTGVSNYWTVFNAPIGLGDPEIWVRAKDGSDCGCKQDLNNFAPRIGLAYRLTNKTVVRASGGIFYGEADTVTGDGSSWSRQTPDFTEVVTPSNRIVPAALVRDGLPVVQLPAAAPVPNTGASASHIQRVNQYNSQWFFDIQQQLPGEIVMTVGYEGTKSTALPIVVDYNFGGPHPSIAANLRRLRPERTAVNVTEFGGNANYNALVTKIEKRYSKGLTFLTSYTWSHNIDMSTQSLDTDFGTFANPFNRQAERSSANLDVRHNFTTSSTWELPFGKGKAFGNHWNGAVDAILGGWQLGGILVFRSGSPFEIRYPGDAQNSGTINRGDRIASGNIANPTIDRWFDELAFVQSAPGVFGNTPRNALVGPGTSNFDFSLSKRFRMPWEGHYAQIRFESFNFTNTPKFAPPNGSLRAATTATINQADDPRRIQFGLKYVF